MTQNNGTYIGYAIFKGDPGYNQVATYEVATAINPREKDILAKTEHAGHTAVYAQFGSEKEARAFSSAVNRDGHSFEGENKPITASWLKVGSIGNAETALRREIAETIRVRESATPAPVTPLLRTASAPAFVHT